MNKWIKMMKRDEWYKTTKEVDNSTWIQKGVLKALGNNPRYINNLYSATVYPHKWNNDFDIFEVSIARRDQSHIHDWRHIQQIKNDIFGDEAEAIELYPAESRLVDAANTFWIYVFPSELGRLPFGMSERAVKYNNNKFGAKQRPKNQLH